MGRYCVVPNCNTGSVGTVKLSLFFIPPNKIEEWERKIPRKDRKLTTRDVICEKHFQTQFVIRETVTSTYSYPLKRPRLSQDAVPTIFPNCPKYVTSEMKKRPVVIRQDGMPRIKPRKKPKVAAVSQEETNQFDVNSSEDPEVDPLIGGHANRQPIDKIEDIVPNSLIKYEETVKTYERKRGYSVTNTATCSGYFEEANSSQLHPSRVSSFITSPIGNYCTKAMVERRQWKPRRIKKELSLDALLSNVMMHKNPTVKTIVNMQFFRKRRRKWGKAEKKLALNLYHVSPKAYRFMLYILKLHLPPITVIQSWL